MSLTHEDIRAAVAAGIITEAQAAALTALGHSRLSAREGREQAEEPFELFKGFNEIFIVIGLTILFTGWAAVLGIFGFNFRGSQGLDTALLCGLTLGGLVLVQRYFTLKRRMIAPSIALVVMFALTALVLGGALARAIGQTGDAANVVKAVLVTALLVWHYRRFRVPFTAAVIACTVFLGVGAALYASGLVIQSPDDLFRLSSHGAMAWVTVALGLAIFAVALRFDMADPHRVGGRAATGFWLHVVAAPAIVNTVALNLLQRGGTGAQLALLLFLVLIACVAIVIDRRSFLVSGAAYTVVLAVTLFSDASAIAILALGLGLVLLGANWERLRGALMRALPEFPGKTDLPPYARTA
jgi:hypothetical protein